MSTQMRSTLGDLGQRNVGPEFEQVFNQTDFVYAGKEVASKIFSFLNVDKSTFRTTSVTGLPYLKRFDEGTPMPEALNIKSFETAWDIDDNGLGVTVTDDCIKDRVKLGAKLEEFKLLSSSVPRSETQSAFQILNGGFVTTATINGTKLARYNAEALFSTSHARADGGSALSNVSAGAITLTELNLETGRLALVQQLSDIGLPIMDMASIMLVVPDALQKIARIITQSTLRSNTNNNDLNFYNSVDGKIDVITSKFLNANVGGSATAWFLVARMPGLESVLRVYRDGAPEFKQELTADRTWNQFFGVKDRRIAGNAEFRTTWASAGA